MTASRAIPALPLAALRGATGIPRLARRAVAAVGVWLVACALAAPAGVAQAQEGPQMNLRRVELTAGMHRIDAQVALLELMQEQERHFSRHNSYLAFSADSQDEDARRFKWFSGRDAAGSAYELRGQACPGQTLQRCIELLALPGTARVDAHFKDPECETLSLTSDGQHRASGREQKCWP